MEKRQRRSFAHRVLLVFGLLLLSSVAVAFFVLASLDGWWGQEWQGIVGGALNDYARRWAPSGADLDKVLKVLGLGFGSLTGVSALIASWHFAEINLPYRLKALAERLQQSQLAGRPRMLDIARRGLGKIPPPPETSKWTHIRMMLGGWTEKARAQLLAATFKRLTDEAEAMAAAAQEAQSRQITSRLLRGCHFSHVGNEREAFAEFEHATRVGAGDIESRDIAAGSARRLGEHQRELSLLAEFKSTRGAKSIDKAIALRREAELFRWG